MHTHGLTSALQNNDHQRIDSTAQAKISHGQPQVGIGFRESSWIDRGVGQLWALLVPTHLHGSTIDQGPVMLTSIIFHCMCADRPALV